MSEPKVRLSNVDRGINVITAVNSYKSRKLNEQILVQQFQNNRHLTDLKRQMSEANEINKKILSNQLKAEEDKEIQKYYKSLSFNLSEIIDFIAKSNDKMIRSYLLSNFYEKLKLNLLEANDKLDEISDKAFNKNSFDKLNTLKIQADEIEMEFNSSILSRLDYLNEDYKTKKSIVLSIKKPELNPKNTIRKKVNSFRTFGIIVLGIISFLILLGLYSSIFSTNVTNDLIVTSLIGLPFIIPFIILLRKEIKWRKGFDEFLKNETQRQIEFEQLKVKTDYDFDQNMRTEQQKLLEHPIYDALSEIEKKYPNFNTTLSELSEVESTFARKWGS